jgi:O-antigen/teichoic acid export membrane protein
VARGVSYLVFSQIAVTVVSVAAFAVIARLISRVDMGVLAVLIVITTGCSFLAGLGVGSAATKFVASFQGAGDLEKASQAGYECIVINFLGTVILAVILFSLSDSLAGWLLGSASRGILIRLLLPEVVAVCMTTSLSSVLVGLRKFREYSIATASMFAVRQGLVVVLLVLGLGLPGIVLGWGVGDLMLAVLLALYSRKFLGPVRYGFGWLRLMRFSAPLFLSDGATYAWSYFDRIILIPLVTLSQLGSYNVAVTAFGTLNNLSNSFSSTLFPFYSHFYADGSKESHKADLERAVNAASRYVALFTVPLAVGLAATALPAATLLAGSNYADAAIPLAALSLSLALACQVKALGSVFVVLERTVTQALVTIGSILIPILIGVLLIPELGIVGASIARGASFALDLVISILILRRLLNIRLDLKAYSSSLIAGLVMAAVVLTVQFVFYSKYLLPVYVLIGALVFIAVLRLTRIVTEDDLRLLSEFLGPDLSFLTKLLRRVFGSKSPETGAMQ